jgi:flagellar motor switch protein FliM
MNQVLSQAEVDALLNAVADGNGDAAGGGDAGGGMAGGGDPFAAAGAGGGADGAAMGDGANILFSSDGPATGIEVTAYDLTNQDRVIRGRMPTLDIIYERFIRLFRISLSNSLRKMASISIISTDLLKFGEFVNTLPIPSCMCIMRFETLKGPGLLVFESKLAYALVDSYFGGTDRPFTKIEGKEFTKIELSIMKKVMDLGMKDLEEAWAPVHKTEIQYVRTEVNPQFVGVVPPSDVIISTTFEVELENASGTIVLVIPYSTIEPIKNKLNSSFQTESDKSDNDWYLKLEEHLRNAQSQLVVNLGVANLTVGDLINLNIGDIVPLNQAADGELDLMVEGVAKFKGFFGVSRGNRAVQITRSIDD